MDARARLLVSGGVMSLTNPSVSCGQSRSGGICEAKSFVVGMALACGILASVTGGATIAEAEERLNVILISLDTVRPDHLSCYGYHRTTSPNIDQIASEGVVFTQAFSQAPSTLPSHLSIFTSRYPRKEWVWWASGDLDPDTESLTEILKGQGYATAAFTGFVDRYPFTHPLVQSRPFRTFDRWVGVSSTSRHRELLRSPPQDLFDWLHEHRAQSFFLFVHGYDAHEPHVLPIQYDAKRFNPTYQGSIPSTVIELDALVAAALAINDVSPLRRDRAYLTMRRKIYQQCFLTPGGVRREDLLHLQAVYDAQLYELDQGLGQLFTALRNLELMERTLLIIVSDHGQALGEHGVFAAHAQCYDEVIRMVLIVRDPRLHSRVRTVRQLVEGIDVLPTILELLDIPLPMSTLGKSLVPLLRTGRDPSREEVSVSVGMGVRAIRTPHWKLMSRTDGALELYHLSKDPKEQRNLIRRHPDIATRLQRRLDAVISADVAGPSVDPEQWMQAHGYW